MRRLRIASRFCSTRVDLPMPGSPPISTIEPLTRPPPSTRLSSSLGIWSRGSSTASIWFTGLGTPLEPRAAADCFVPADAVLIFSSTMVFHAPHPGHLPVHFGASAPHSVQNHMVFCRTLAISAGGNYSRRLFQATSDVKH